MCNTVLLLRSEQIVVEIKVKREEVVVVRIYINNKYLFSFLHQFKLFVEGIIRALPGFAKIKEI